MNALNDSSNKANTGNLTRPEPKHLMTIGTIGAALIGYQLSKTQTARQQLVKLASAAIEAGELDDQEQVVVGHVLAQVSQLTMGRLAEVPSRPHYQER